MHGEIFAMNCPICNNNRYVRGPELLQRRERLTLWVESKVKKAGKEKDSPKR